MPAAVLTLLNWAPLKLTLLKTPALVGLLHVRSARGLQRVVTMLLLGGLTSVFTCEQAWQGTGMFIW